MLKWNLSSLNFNQNPNSQEQYKRCQVHHIIQEAISLFLKRTENILDFAAHNALISQSYHHREKEAIDSIQVNMHGCVPMKPSKKFGSIILQITKYYSFSHFSLQPFKSIKVILRA